MRSPFPRARACLLAALAAAACGGGAGPKRVVAREVVLKRQIEGLETLIASAQRGELFPRDRLVVAVHEEMVRELAALALPREEVIAEDYRVRLDRVDVSFRDRWGSVRLDGRVSPAGGSANDVFAELAVFGQLDAVEVDPGTGVLSGRVSVIGFELQRFGVFGESAAGRRLVERLAEQQAEALAALASPITIPVRLEQEITLKGLGPEGPVRVRPARFPLKVTVADVSAHGGRLWVALDVEAGPWTRRPARTAAGGRR